MSHGFCVILTRVFPRCLPEQPSFRRFLQAVVFLLHTNRLFGRKKSNSFVGFFSGVKKTQAQQDSDSSSYLAGSLCQGTKWLVCQNCCQNLVGSGLTTEIQEAP